VDFGASYESQLFHMDFQFGLGKTVTFWLITPTHFTPCFTCCTFCWVGYGGAGGGDVTIGQVHPWQLWDQGCKGTFMNVEWEIGDVGVPGHDGTFYYFA
jgi:hypothetical protein